MTAFINRVAHLAGLPEEQYDRQRKQVADELGVQLRTLDNAVARHRKQADKSTAASFAFEELEPWPQTVSGADLLGRLSAEFRRFVVLGQDEADTAALWTLKTFCFDAFDTSPILAIESATPRCGKTTMLSVTAALVYRPITASNISPAALFRFIDAHRPTMLLDEADTWAKADENIRGVLNSGHTRSGAHVIRCQGEGKDLETRRFSTWCPKLVALIGRLPLTLQDRSLVILLRRKLPTEPVERYRHDRPPADFLELRRRCLRWAGDHFAELRERDPALPDRLHDRARDNWRPLMALAELAGEEWPQRASSAALRLSNAEGETASNTELLLADIAAFFEGRATERVRSQEVAEHLAGQADRPWSEFNRGRGITTHQLARQLEPLGVRPRKVRFGNSTAQGYERAWFEDAFRRYLPRQTGTPEQTTVINQLHGGEAGTAVEDVPARTAPNPLYDRGCSEVPSRSVGLTADCSRCVNFKPTEGHIGECIEGHGEVATGDGRECADFLRSGLSPSMQ